MRQAVSLPFLESAGNLGCINVDDRVTLLGGRYSNYQAPQQFDAGYCSNLVCKHFSGSPSTQRIDQEWGYLV